MGLSAFLGTLLLIDGGAALELLGQTGYDPVWFGIIIVMVVELGLITPPIGMNVFVIKGIASDVPLATIFRGVTPFIVAQIILILILVAFPQIALWLPSTMAG
jgi:C4-dicarboxylate transporter, DctM subunit